MLTVSEMHIIKLDNYIEMLYYYPYNSETHQGISILG